MDAAVESLSTAAAGSTTGAVALARIANAVSAPMPDLFGLYEDPVPPGVLDLDYLGREVVLDAREGDFAAATKHIDTIDTTFAAIRTALEAANGKTEATAFAASVATLRAKVDAKDAAGLEAEATTGLDVVDNMEAAFTKSAAAAGEVAD